MCNWFDSGLGHDIHAGERVVIPYYYAADANLMLAASGTSFAPLDQRREQVRGVALAAREHVGVDRHRHHGARVAEPVPLQYSPQVP